MTEIEILNDAVPAKHFSKPPYHAETFSTGVSFVCNESGYNCLRFKSKPGAIFTNHEMAKIITEKWNNQGQ